TSGFPHVGYIVAKGGGRALTQALCRELAPFASRLNAVAPGYMHTDMGGKGDGSTDEWLNWHCPMKRFGQPHEVAGPIVFLASPAASFVNGVTLPIDGGYLVVWGSDDHRFQSHELHRCRSRPRRALLG